MVNLELNINRHVTAPVTEVISKERILIIDDDPFNLVSLKILLKLTLKKLGLPEVIIEKLVDQGSNGQQAVDLFKELSETD